MGIVIFKQCTRGATYTKSEWNELEHVGTQEMTFDDGGPDMHLEYRNCTCGSTMAFDHNAVETPKPPVGAKVRVQRAGLKATRMRYWSEDYDSGAGWVCEVEAL